VALAARDFGLGVPCGELVVALVEPVGKTYPSQPNISTLLPSIHPSSLPSIADSLDIVTGARGKNVPDFSTAIAVGC
jgi:hypothetical protein